MQGSRLIRRKRLTPGRKHYIRISAQHKGDPRMFRRLSSKVISTLVVLLLLAHTAAAQNFRGGINGTVTDPTGAEIPGAKISAVASGTSAQYNSISSSAGEFLFQDLPIGLYTISVELFRLHKSTRCRWWRVAFTRCR
jgi:hypothetical protein